MVTNHIGMDVGGTFTKICIVDDELNVLKKYKVPTDVYDGILTFLKNIIDDAIKEYDVKTVSIGFPGVVDSKKGTLDTAPSIIKGRMNVKEELEKIVDVKIYIDNDVTCWAAAEGKVGSCVGVEDYVLLTIGTGIGASLILNSQPYKGFDNAAGEIGYMVFLEDLKQEARTQDEFGSFESKSSAKAMIEDYKKQVNKDLSAEEILDSFFSGDEAAKDFFSKRMDYLAVSLANIITILHPKTIVIGGGITERWQEFEGLLKEKIHRLICTKTQIVASTTGSYGGAIGAVILGLEH